MAASPTAAFPLLAPVTAESDRQVSAKWLGSVRPQAAMIARAMLMSTNGDAGQGLFVESCVHALLAGLPRADEDVHVPSPPAASKLNDARELLELRHADPPTISALKALTCSSV